MISKLFMPREDIIVPKMPSYVKLAMGFPIGAGAQLMDKSRYRSHGTISGASWAAGLHGYALDFNSATPDYVEIAAAYSQLNFTSEKFSMVARIKLDDLTQDRKLLVRGKGNTDGYEVMVHSNGRVFFRTWQSGAQQQSYSGLGDISTATWYTVGISRDGASVTLFVDGVDCTASGGTHINPATCARAALIGIYEGKVLNPLDGKVEFLRIFGGIALSASEHLAWHNALA